MLDLPWSVRVLDLRHPENCAVKRVPGAECVGAEGLDGLGLQYATGSRDLVLVDEGDIHEVPAAALAYKGRLFTLQGGHEAWVAYALTAPESPPAGASAADHDEYRLRSGVAAAMTGIKQAPPPPVATVAAAPAKGGGPFTAPFWSLVVVGGLALRWILVTAGQV